MYILNKQIARKNLLEEKFPATEIDQLLERYGPLDETFAQAVDRWLATKIVSDVVVEGISLVEVMKIRRSHFLVAVRQLNHLLDPKLPPEKKEQWRRILQTPVFYE